MKDDYRNFLFESYIKVVEYFQPKIILFENVEGILSAIPTGEKITSLIKQGFNNIGYEIIDDLRKNALFDMSDFGVPQKRKRVIIIGVRRDNQSTDYQEILNQIYSLIHNLSTHQQTKTVRDAISDLPPLIQLKSTRTKLIQ